MEKIINTPIIEEVEDSFLGYAVNVITDRAIPSVYDGLKPVTRRILWDMYVEKAASNKPYKKCAEVVGSTMGSYHPHGLNI